MHLEREADDYTRDKTDHKDAVLIGRLVVRLECYLPERVPDAMSLTGLVTSMPGVSAVGAAAILAETGDPSRSPAPAASSSPPGSIRSRTRPPPSAAPSGTATRYAGRTGMKRQHRVVASDDELGIREEPTRNHSEDRAAC
ncbi:hypothetical protein AB0H83_32630 [Dactylosporangium sp. NPDC050688]|uniref:hypothetical protein n=1 Tax=Dactylosporangium sp. NPDC050688 TaxID=3157217 RepID=UPI0033D2F13C